MMVYVNLRSLLSDPPIDIDEFVVWRSQHDLTQGDVAYLFGVTRTTVSRWERGHTDFPKTVSSFVNLTKRIGEGYEGI